MSGIKRGLVQNVIQARRQCLKATEANIAGKRPYIVARGPKPQDRKLVFDIFQEKQKTKSMTSQYHKILVSQYIALKSPSTQ